MKMVKMDSVKLRRELQVSQLLCYQMTENVEKITFASEKGEKPLGTFINTDSKFLSYPTICCGKTPSDNKNRTTPVHCNTICKRELRNQDKRAPKSVPNMFYIVKKVTD